jgi:hypothetical protein
MRYTSVSLLSSLAFIMTCPVVAGESPYNPGAPSQSEVLKKMPNSYYCTAQGNGESKWYVTGFEPAPNFGTPQYETFNADTSVAFTEYMYATYGRNRVMYPHCTSGPSEKLRPSWEQMQHEPRFKETVHVNWRYGESAAPAV